MDWVNGGTGPSAVVEASGEEVTLSLTAGLGHLRLGWSVVATATADVARGEANTVEVPLEVPREAWLSDAAADHVTDLTVEVKVGDRELPGAQVFLVWPDGQGLPPQVWTQETVDDRAPQGVFREELRVAEAKDGVARVMPMLFDTSPDQPSNVDDVEREVEP